MYMYIKDKLSVIERVFLEKKYTKKHVFVLLFAKFTFSAKMRHMEKRFLFFRI